MSRIEKNSDIVGMKSALIGFILWLLITIITFLFRITIPYSLNINEVNANRPFILSMLNGGIPVGGSGDYGEHSVTCMEYYDGNTDYVLLHDTWDTTTTRYLAFGSWTGTVSAWVRP